MVTAATTASSVSPPFLRISIPLSRACTPFALEMINGRLPCAAGARLASESSPLPLDGVRPKSLPAPAMALPASEVRKNLRRDQRSIWIDSWVCGRQYTVDRKKLKVSSRVTSTLRRRQAVDQLVIVPFDALLMNVVGSLE